ncbi:DUF3299 domain-containing protein [Henriciella sp. AS95]|uniref:DUF3299 domain-containing protein n=1 Tax=Henriciella sp. AS95 TaxID=3135782 RepID=UPI003170424A
MKTLFFSASAFGLLALAGCGGPQDDLPDPAIPEQTDTSDIDAAKDAILIKAESGDGPQIGDKIPEPEASSDDSSIAQAGADEKAKADAVAARGVTEIGWEELMPEGEEERLAEMYQAQMAMLYSGSGVAEGSSADQAIQIGTFNTVKDMDGMKVRLPGYTVPFEYGKDANIREFLLVPYYGACLHAPPPPPNQTVFVKTDKEIKLRDLSQAVWIEGTLRTQTQTSDLADAAYTIEMTDWEIYEY